MVDEDFRAKFYELIRESVSIDCTKVHGQYGSAGYVEVKLMLNGECISSIYIDDKN